MNKQELNFNICRFVEYKHGRMTREELIKMYITNGSMNNNTALDFVDYLERNYIGNTTILYELCCSEGWIDEDEV